MRYETGIRATRALTTDVSALLAAIEASADFEPDAFRTFAKLGNVREWFAPLADDPRGRAVLGETVAQELLGVAAAQPAKKQALVELGRDVQEALQAAGIPVLFLKGLFVADRFYGDLHRRHQYDLDVLVSPADLARATETLTILGFEIDERAARRLGRTRGREAAPAPQTITLQRSDGLEVDVHGRTKSRWFGGLDEAWFWRDRQPVTVREFTFETLSDEHTLLLQSISLALDLRRGAGRVKHFLDLYLMFRALDDEIDWSRWLASRAEDGLLPPVATVWTALLILWDCAEEFPALALALGEHRNAVKLRGPGEALRIVQRPRRSRANLAWFAKVRPARSLSGRLQDFTVHQPIRLWQSVWPIERRGRWPWDRRVEHVLRFVYPPVRIDLKSEDADIGTWLAETLAPSFEISEPDDTAPDHTVTFIADPARCQRLAAPRDAATRTLDGFTYDGTFSRHPAWADENDGSLWVADPDRDVFIHVDDDTRRIEVVARSAEESSTRARLLRVVRELATAAMARARRLPVHGAAIAVEGQVVLICGPKRAGKTSLLIHALECGATFVANDRVFVEPREAVEARGMPTIVMLRRGSLDLFPELGAAFDEARYDYARRIAACAPGIERSDPRDRYEGREPGISPLQLATLVDAPMLAGGPLRAVLFPRIDPSAEGLTLQPATAEASLDAMRRSLIKPSDPARSSQVFAPRDEPTSPESEEAWCRALLARVPAFDCRLGPDAFDHNVLEALADATRPPSSSTKRPRSVLGRWHGLEPGGVPLLADAGFDPVSSELIHERQSHSGRRALYRIRLAGGASVKLRRYERLDRAEASARVRGQVEDRAFSRLLASEGLLVLEEWIDGTVLDAEEQDPTRIREAARLLARLHGMPLLAADTPKLVDWHEVSLQYLEGLSSDGRLSDATSTGLRKRLRRSRPAQHRVGAVHGDFCAQNMLLDAQGRLRVFDNEGFAVDAPGYDLGRTWCRWPLPPDRWQLFLDTYDEASPAPLPRGDLEYWKTVAALQSAHIRSAWKDGLDAALLKLADLATEG